MILDDVELFEWYFEVIGEGLSLMGDECSNRSYSSCDHNHNYNLVLRCVGWYNIVGCLRVIRLVLRRALGGSVGSVGWRIISSFVR